VAAAARRNGGDVVGAAAKLRVRLADHASVIAQVEVATTRIADGIAEMQRTGQLRAFNSLYAARRAEAAASGQTFPSQPDNPWHDLQHGASNELRHELYKLTASATSSVARQSSML
jgi:hypothetical protein